MNSWQDIKVWKYLFIGHGYRVVMDPRKSPSNCHGAIFANKYWIFHLDLNPTSAFSSVRIQSKENEFLSVVRQISSPEDFDDLKIIIHALSRPEFMPMSLGVDWAFELAESAFKCDMTCAYSA